MILSLFSFLIFIKIILSKITPLNERKYKWQIHSYNDPREIKQLSRKGSTLYKIDLYYVRQSKCYTDDLNLRQDLRGCFLLTHDKPIEDINYPNIYKYINSIIDNQRYFKNRGIKFNLDLCFKNTPSNICEYNEHEWISLVDDIYKYINEMILNYELDLEIIYDGKKLDCLRKKWPLWNYTWIRNRDPDEAFYSNDIEKSYNKFSVFNDEYIHLENDSLLNWGKFKNIERPLQVWEPNNQKDIQYCQTIFEQKPHNYGYAFSINIDTSMFQVFSAEISKENINHNFEKNLNIIYSIFEVINGKMFFFNNQKNILKVYFFNNNNLLESEKEIEVKFLPKGELKEIIYIKRDKDKYSFLIFNNIGLYCENLIDIKSLKILYSNCNQNDIIKYILRNENSIENKKYYGYYNPISNNLNIKLFSVSLLNNSNIIFAFVPESKPYEIHIINIKMLLDFPYINFDNFPYISKAIILSKEIQNINIKCSFENCLLLYSLKEDENKINSFFIEIKEEFQLISNKYKYFGVGENYSLKVFNSPKDKKDKFFLVKDSAYCYHNEKNNKNANILMCDQKEISIPYVLNYIYGNLEKEKEKDEDKIENNYSSVCSNYTITGTYDRGDNPKISIYFENNEFNFIEVHNGVNENVKNEINDNCGLSNFYQGIVADNWNIGDIEENNFF